MPLPTTISDLFTIESSNSPSGGESPILTDNYLRFMAAFIAQLRDGPGFVTAVRSNSLGSVSVPAFSFVGDTNTGAWSPAADTYAISTAGVESLRIGVAGNVTIAAPSSGTALTVSGDLAYTGTLTGGAGIVNLGSGQVYKDASGNVGIGTAAPSTKLHVVGSTTLGTAVADTLSVGGAVVKNSTGNWTIAAPSSGTALTVDGLVQSRALAAAGASAGVFGASSWLTQNEAGFIRTYYCGPSGAVYQPWEIYRATSTGSPLAVLTLSAAGNVTIAAPSSGVALTVSGTANFTGAITASGGVVGALTGNAVTATALATARLIGGTSFDGSANIAVALATAATTAGTVTTAAQPTITSLGALTALTVAGDMTVNGNTALGDAAADTLSVSGAVVKNAAGNWTIAAPSSGVGLTVAGGGMTVTGQVVFSPGSYVGIGRTSNLAVKLDVDGALALSVPISTSAATFAVLPDHSAIRCAATCTISLPAPVSCPGRLITICNVGAFAVTNSDSNVFPLGSATAGTAILAATSGKFAQLQSNGTNWITLMAN